MKKFANTILIKGIAIIMIGIMTLMITNQALFLHTHKLSDGTITAHAHPYDKSTDSKPYKTHQHTNSLLLFYQNISILFFVVFLTFALLVPFTKAKLSFVQTIRYYFTYTIHKKGRAPPLYNSLLFY